MFNKDYFYSKNYYNMNGLCLYLFGRSGSGKTTIANQLKNKLINYDKRIVTELDGDELRKYIGQDLGFSKKDRSINIRRIGYVANIIVNNNGIALVSNIAPYIDDREYNKNLIENNNNKYVDIFINTSLKECIKRDPKGLYNINNERIIQSYNEFEEPKVNNCKLIINTDNQKLSYNTDEIFNYLIKNNYLYKK